jgi:hypothetical protein
LLILNSSVYVDSGNGTRGARVRFRDVPATDQADMDGQ